MAEDNMDGREWPERVRGAADEMLAIVHKRLPERFYNEPAWRLWATAFVARMAGTVEAVRDLTDGRRQADATVLVRALYEHMVTFAWVMIDPEPRMSMWGDDARVELRKLHNDAANFGVSVLSEDEMAYAKTAKPLPPLDQLATAVDEYWSPRVRGFRAHPVTGPKQLRTVRGLYVAVYRLASRLAHGQPQSLHGFIDDRSYPLVVGRERDDSVMSSALVVPIFSMALLVCNQRLGWPDDDDARKISDALLHDVEDDD